MRGHTGSQLLPNSMNLDDVECQNKGFMDFFGDFGLRDTFQWQIAPKLIETDREKLCTKFSALNVDRPTKGQSLDFLGSRKPDVILLLLMLSQTLEIMIRLYCCI